MKIIQHNVQSWSFNSRNELSSYYQMEDPNIIPLNSTCQMDQNHIKMFGYNVHQRNARNMNHAGIMIVIKRIIRYKLLGDFQDDLLGIQVETRKGPVIVTTCYLPPRRQAFTFQDITSLSRRTILVYVTADLNARHQFIVDTNNNQTGNILNNLMQRGLLTHMEPNFTMWIATHGVS